MSSEKRIAHRRLALLALVLCFTASQASAGESPWYVEARIGQPRLDGDLGVSRTLEFRVDDDVSSVGVEVGYTFNRFFAVQAGYRELGQTPVVLPDCIACDLIPFDAEISGWSLAAVPQWPIGERFSLYAKLGVFRWDADLKSLFGDPGEVSEDDLLAALGVHYGFPSGFGILLEYEVVADLFDGANLGLRWRF